MGEHLTNPRALAKQQGGQQLNVADLGDGIVFAGLAIEPRFRPASDEEGAPMMLYAVLVAIGGKHSPIALTAELKQVVLGEIGAIPVEKVKAMFAAKPEPEQTPQ